MITVHKQIINPHLSYDTLSWTHWLEPIIITVYKQILSPHLSYDTLSWTQWIMNSGWFTETRSKRKLLYIRVTRSTAFQLARDTWNRQLSQPNFSPSFYIPHLFISQKHSFSVDTRPPLQSQENGFYYTKFLSIFCRKSRYSSWSMDQLIIPQKDRVGVGEKHPGTIRLWSWLEILIIIRNLVWNNNVI